MELLARVTEVEPGIWLTGATMERERTMGKPEGAEGVEGRGTAGDPEVHGRC